MFVVLLKFSDNKEQAGRFMAGHKAWIDRGIEDGVFLLVGSLQPNVGGAIMVHNSSLAALLDRLNDDPFVIERVVTADILEVTPSRTDGRLAFLLT